MNSKSISSFSKLLTICERNKILKVDINQNVISDIQYGPLGLLLRKNIFKEWFSFSLYNSEIHMLPVHMQKALVMTSACNSHSPENPLIKEIIQHYKNAGPLVGQQLPFALSVSCGCMSSTKRIVKGKSQTEIVNGDQRFLWKPKRWTSLLIAFFCTPNKSMNWFYFWQRQRYAWWRKFSSVPSKFSISDISQKSSDDQTMSLQMNFPWDFEKLETVSLTGPSILKDLFDNTSSANKDYVPSMIMCKLDLDFAVLAYLCDAFENKLQQGESKAVLHLNHKLAPYKVTVTIDCKDQVSSKKLLDLSNHLVKEFKQNFITVLPNPYVTENSLNIQFEKFDEMGIPYVVVLSEGSMLNGLAGLRNRDTTLQEQVHITELSEKLLIYLQMKISLLD